MTVRLDPITPSDGSEVASYLARAFGTDPGQAERRMKWASGLAGENLGFALHDDDRLVGVFIATYARTPTGQRVCHLGGWHVEERYRLHSLRLFTAILAQPVDAFTDYTPTAAVRPLNRRMGFTDLDTSAVAIWNGRISSIRHRARLVTDDGEIMALLTEVERRYFEDHREVPSLFQLVAVRGTDRCHVVYRLAAGRLTRTRLLYVSDRALFRRYRSQILTYILRRHRSLFTEAEVRTLGTPPRFVRRAPAVSRQYKSATLAPSELGELYSSLVWAE